MRTNGTEWGMCHLFPEDKMVADKIDENIENSIGTATCCIPEGLQGHEPAEGRIKVIYGRNNAIF